MACTKAPSTKLQAPEKLQISSSKPRSEAMWPMWSPSKEGALRFGAWNFSGDWRCDLELPSRVIPAKRAGNHEVAELRPVRSPALIETQFGVRARDGHLVEALGDR